MSNNKQQTHTRENNSNRLTRLSSAVIVAVEHISFCQMNHKYIR